MRTVQCAAPLLFTIVASGCASSMSGVGGTERYGCQAPAGVQCTSVSGVYANTHHGQLRPTTQTPAARERPAPQNDGATPNIARPATPAIATGNAIRSNTRVLRVWIAPWEDSDGDLNEDTVVHVIVDAGRWLIEHVRRASRNRIDAVTPPLTGHADAPPQPAQDPAAPSERLPRPPGTGASTAEPVVGAR